MHLRMHTLHWTRDKTIGDIVWPITNCNRETPHGFSQILAEQNCAFENINSPEHFQ